MNAHRHTVRSAHPPSPRTFTISCSILPCLLAYVALLLCYHSTASTTPVFIVDIPHTPLLGRTLKGYLNPSPSWEWRNSDGYRCKTCSGTFKISLGSTLYFIYFFQLINSFPPTSSEVMSVHRISLCLSSVDWDVCFWDRNDLCKHRTSCFTGRKSVRCSCS